MYLVNRLILVTISFFMMASCTPRTHQGFVKRSDAIFCAMIRVLEQVEHPSDFHLLQAMRPLYMEIAELVLLSFKQEEKSIDLFSLEILEAPHQEKLKQELMRIYNLEGGRQACEVVARDGLTLLQKNLGHIKNKRF